MTDRDRPAGNTCARRTGFTLIELLVVISIIAMLCGVTIGVYYGLVRQTALDGETRAVMGIVQAARSAAAAGRETFIRVDTETGRLYPFSRTTVGVWHFEVVTAEGSPGAFGHAAVAADGEPKATPGKIGGALRFDGTYSLRCKMNRGGEWVNIPTYDTRDGVAIEAWILPRDTGAEAMAVVSRDGWFDLWLEYDAGMKRFALAASATTLDADGSGYRLRSATSEPVIRPNEWTHVSMSCHKLSDSVVLRVNGIEPALEEQAASAGSTPAPDAESAIGAGADGGDPFHGAIDEVGLSTYAAATVHRIVGKLTLDAANLAPGNTIRFDASGQLDAAHGGATPQLILKDMKGQEVTSSVTISIGAMGALDVDVWHK